MDDSELAEAVTLNRLSQQNPYSDMIRLQLAKPVGLRKYALITIIHFYLSLTTLQSGQYLLYERISPGTPRHP